MFCFVTIAAAWNLEEDEDSGIASGSTDGAPFGYTTGGLYYSTDVHLQTLHTLVGIQKNYYHDSVRSVFCYPKNKTVDLRTTLKIVKNVKSC